MGCKWQEAGVAFTAVLLPLWLAGCSPGANWQPATAKDGVRSISLNPASPASGAGFGPAYETVSGPQITAGLQGVYWQLPAESGSYSLTVSYHGHAKAFTLKLPQDLTITEHP